MSGELQKKLIPLFRYALKPGGFLFLGTSETVGEYGALFETQDRKAKTYQRKEDFSGEPRTGLSRFLPPMTMPVTSSAKRSTNKTTSPGKQPMRELTEQAILQQIAPTAILVNSQSDILYLHGRTGLYLEPTPGEAGVNNILKMARQGLERDLASALRQAATTKEVVRRPGLRVKTNGDFSNVTLTVRPVATGVGTALSETLFLVVLEEDLSAMPKQATQITGESLNVATETTETSPTSELTEARALIAALTLELRTKDEHLQSTHEQLETSNEELKSSNEEMQSINEELQSTNEELETSKEELQSVNEELATVNAELQNRVADLSRANDDLNNLLAGSGIATVFVDHQLRIRRFTPAATQIINLIPGDAGRPVGHIVSNLPAYTNLVADVQGVLNTLIPKEVNVQTQTEAWYTMRIVPYRTLDNVIEGAVITFVNITEQKLA